MCRNADYISSLVNRAPFPILSRARALMDSEILKRNFQYPERETFLLWSHRSRNRWKFLSWSFLYGTSTIYRTIFITKITVRSRPFFEMENACPLEISNHISNWKMTVHKSITHQFSLPTWRVIYSLSDKGVISMIPIFYRKYENFILDRGFVRVYVVCSSVGIYWSFTSPSWTLSRIK